MGIEDHEQKARVVLLWAFTAVVVLFAVFLLTLTARVAITGLHDCHDERGEDEE